MSRVWWRDAVVYQIYVRSFADSDGDGIGDLGGIRSRVPYIAALGVDSIWLTPCYPSPQRDHGYDVADYFDIEPQYGTLGDLDALVATCRDAGLRVLMDIVPCHCSSQHAWFREALASPPGSAARARFFFRDGRGSDGELPPNNWRAMFGGSSWTRVVEADGRPGQWYLHTFTPWQPDFDWDNPDVVDHFDRVLRFWFDRGIDGFRVDAIPFAGKAPGLPDAPEPPAGARATDGAAHNEHTWFRASAHDIWRHWRDVLDTYERDHPGRELTLVAEAYAPNRVDLLASFVADDEFHQAFTFDLMMSPWNASQLRGAIEESYAALQGTSLTWTLNNHDTQRAVTRYGRVNAHDPSTWTGSNLVYTDAAVDVDMGTRRARAVAVMVAALPGSLYLYQGEELGLPEVLDLPDAARTDPIFFRTDGAEIGRDGCRIPLPWDGNAETGFGFSPAPATPWLPQPPEWGAWSVAAEDGRAESMIELYRRILAARRALVTKDAPLEWILPERPELVAFTRGDLRVILNPTGNEVAVDELGGDEWRVVLSSVIDHDEPQRVPGDSCLWLAR